MKKPTLTYVILVLLTAFYIACGSDDGTTPPTDDGSGITDDDPSTDDDPKVNPPTITKFEPTSGIIGTTVIITGNNFSTTASNNEVEFNGENAEVQSATGTQLTVTVPYGAITGKISVATADGSIQTTSDFTVPPPTITSFSPDEGTVGTEVIIIGAHFSTTLENNLVVFNGTPATITDAQAAQLTVNVPEGTTTGKISVNVGGQEVESTDDFAMWNPTISSFDPQQGVAGDLITIHGEHFHTTPANNIVKFNGVSATVHSSSLTELSVFVPEYATTGKISITVAGQLGESSEDFILPWEELAPFPGEARYGAVMAVLEDGNGNDIIMAGLGLGLTNNADLKDLWMYNIVNNTWEAITDFPAVARNGSFSFELDNKWYVGSGHRSYGLGAMNDLWVYDPLDSTWTQLNDHSMYLRSSSAFAIQSKGYIYGGKYTTPNYSEKLREFDPNNNPEWNDKSSLELNNSGRSDAAVFTLNDRGYIATGFDGTNLLQDLWMYDPNSNVWTQKANYGGGAVQYAVGFSIDGIGFIGLGAGNIYRNDLWKYDSASDSWEQKTSFPGNGKWGANAVTHDGKAYILFGNSEDDNEELRFLEYTPALDD